MAAQVVPLALGARNPAKSDPPTRPTRAEIDLGAFAHNLRAVRQMAGDSRVFAVVKADAYGHGLIPIAQCLEREGVDGLCVALAEEGLALRAAGVRAPVLVLNGAYGAAHARVLAAQLTPVIYSLAQAEAFAAAAPARIVPVHLKIDTGMARLGVPLDQLGALLDAMAHLPGLRVDGVMTHLSSADTDAEATREQLERFDSAVALVRDRGHRPRFVHAANSAATFGHRQARYDLVRVGLALYGVSPIEEGEGAVAGHELRAAMSVRSEVIALRDLPAGSPVGYDRTFRTTRASRVATVPIGYGDGLMRAASNRAHLLVRGVRCPIVGRVSMDLTTIDVTDVPDAAVGDDAVLIGRQGEAELTAAHLGEACQTIAYEVLTNVSPRVPRLYRP